MSGPLKIVKVLDEPGLYEVVSSSSTVYYVDTRPSKEGPSYMRWRGHGITLASPMDNNWQPLLVLTSGPTEFRDGRTLMPVEIDQDDWMPWTLRVGSGHRFETRRMLHPNGSVYWVFSRACEAITVVDEMPPAEARARKDTWL